MRLSSNLRRYRWAVFAAWLLLLVPSIYLAMHQSGNLTGGGSKSRVPPVSARSAGARAALPRPGASPLALVAAPRADASFDDMTSAVTRLERIAAEVPSVKVVPNPQQPPPSRTARMSSRCSWTSTPVRSTSPNSFGRKSASPAIGPVDRERQGQALRHRPGRAGGGGDSGHQARHRAGRTVEPSDRPDCFARGVRVVGRGGDATCIGHLHRCGDHGAGLSAVDVYDDVGVRHVDGVHVRYRTGDRLLTIYSHAVPRGTARRP